ncbi:cation:proton antiporter [Corynebacterium sp. A21]|uniref:cation:proton antiporter n=1 Tax=Corynebacterium sp. A21 TaxID=3457318 RepID=UPI003FD212A8
MTILLMLTGLLLATVLVTALGDRTGLPWPALLTLLAAGGALIPFTPDLNIPAEIILPIFLPPLLWALARKTSWAVIRSQFATIASLSVLLVFVTIAVLAGTTWLLLPGIGISAAIVLAAALAPPDPVAVDAVAEPAGIPKRITTVLQTEGLFNDAASIVTFHVALAALVAGSELSFTQGAIDFFISVIAAIVIGLLAGRLAAWFTDHVASIEARNALTWVLPFAIYALAEEVGGSGVIAIVIAAVEMNSRASIGAEDRLSGHAFWGTVEMLFTGVAFGLIGLNVRAAIEEVGGQLWHAVWIGAVLSVVCILVRFIWLFFAYKANRRKVDRHGASPGMKAPLRLQEVLLMTWAGMRGLVTLALVLSIPKDLFPFHHELTVIALVVLLLTMVIPGLTLPWLVSRLDLDSGPDAAGDQAREDLSHRARHAAYDHLLQHASLPEESIENIRNWISNEMEAEAEQTKNIKKLRTEARRARTEALHAAQQELLQARRERGINPAYVDEMLVTVDRMLMAAER